MTHTHKQDLLIIPMSVPVAETAISVFIFFFPDLIQGSELVWSWPGPLQPERKGCEAGQRDHPHVQRSLPRLYVLLHPAGQHSQGLRPRHHHPVHHQDFRSAQRGYQVGGWCLGYPLQTEVFISKHVNMNASSAHYILCRIFRILNGNVNTCRLCYLERPGPVSSWEHCLVFVLFVFQFKLF